MFIFLILLKIKLLFDYCNINNINVSIKIKKIKFMKYNIILLLFLIHSVLNSQMIRQMVNAISAKCPEMKAILERDPVLHTSELRPIVGNGFTYYNQRLVGMFYGGVMVDYLNDFLNDVSNDMKFENESHRKKFVDLFQLANIVSTHFIMPRIMFKSKDPKSQGCFFVGMSELINSNSIDFLFLNIRTEFKLAPDYFLATRGKGNLFWGSTKQYLIERPRYLTIEQVDKLFAFFQISMFQSAEKILKFVKAIK